jgi:uncharacterized protein (DUF924 family)
MDPLAVAILDFWFGPPGSPERGADRDVWFRKDTAFDDAVRQRFGDAVNIAVAGGFGEWCTSAGGALARVLLLDQFTRNIFRDTPRAFAGDARALATAEDAIARGLDRELEPHGRWFLYMPFEHAEEVAAQRRSLELFGALGEDMNDPSPLEWAQKHADVIFRFGRFPHRNAILGRESTPDELEFLTQQGSRF